VNLIDKKYNLKLKLIMTGIKKKIIIINNNKLNHNVEGGN